MEPAWNWNRRQCLRWSGVLAGTTAWGARALAAQARVVVVYAALDREFSEPILNAYADREGVDLRPKFDVESTKTVGLTNLLVAETGKGRTRCDLFWNNEILNTIRLKRKGVLQPFRPDNAEDYPEAFRDKDGHWYGFAARARILLINTDLVSDKERPAGIIDLTDPRWKGRVGLAKPLFGTTATHAACLFASWGEQRAKRYFEALKANGAAVFSGNKQVAQAVSAGRIAVGMTDTDDAMIEIAQGKPVAIVYPDGKPDQIGTLFLPNTLAIPRFAPHFDEAVKLAGHLLGSSVENALANGPSAQIPLGKNAKAPARVETPATVHPMTVDFEAAADGFETTARFLVELFGR